MSGHYICDRCGYDGGHADYCVYLRPLPERWQGNRTTEEMKIERGLRGTSSRSGETMTDHTSTGTAPPPDLADRIELYLDEAPYRGGHSDAAGADAWELLREAMEQLRAPAQKSVESTDPQTKRDTRLIIADEYEAGLRKMEASGYEEFSDAILRHKVIIAALRDNRAPAQSTPVPCSKCSGSGRIEYEITNHGERNERVRDKCNRCGGTGTTLPSTSCTSPPASESSHDR